MPASLFITLASQDAVFAMRGFHIALLTEYPVFYSWNIKNRAFYKGAYYLCKGIYQSTQSNCVKGVVSHINGGTGWG
jgi:hypothetical protein